MSTPQYGAPFKSVIREIRELYSKYDKAVCGQIALKDADIERYSHYLWALEEVEDMIFASPGTPLVVIEKFMKKMEAYSNVNEDFKDASLAMEMLIDNLV